MNILRSRLYEIEKEKREAELDELRGPKREISFEIRLGAIILYPYQFIKDLGTGQKQETLSPFFQTAIWPIYHCVSSLG